jgi:Terminase small subunit
MATRQWRRRGRGASARAAGPPAVEDVEARAARLGITPDRVLREYRRIAFANLRHILDWDGKGMEVKPSKDLSEDDVAAIAEIVEAAGTGKPYRVKLYDKKAALDAIARYLGMLPKPAPTEADPTQDEGEDPREFLKRELARLAARGAEE